MLEVELLKWLNSIGTAGLGFMVWALMRGHLVTRRENDREIARGDKLEARCEKLEQKLDKALEYGHRAVGTSERLIEKQQQ